MVRKPHAPCELLSVVSGRQADQKLQESRPPWLSLQVLRWKFGSVSKGGPEKEGFGMELGRNHSLLPADKIVWTVSSQGALI